jgi:hypothetical protein
MTLDPEDLAQLRAALEESGAVGTTRVDLVSTDRDEVVLRGAVASAEEADTAALIVEQQGATVVNELHVDPALREGLVEPVEREEAVPAEGELLVGDPDMLAGPDAAITGSREEAFEENEPWDPPDEPLLPPTLAEQRGLGPADETGIDVAGLDEADEVDDGRPAAADLTAQDLREAAEGRPLPALDPELDAAAADPLRGASGGSMDDLGTDRGPETQDDPPPRERFPERG